jgi:predicted dehydrogenase
MTLRIGLAGLGVHGGRYAGHLLRGEVEGARLTAVSRADERRGRRFAEAHGVAFVAEPAALADHPRVDAVVLCLPPHLHPAAALACIERRRPVLVEKPLAPDPASAARLAERVAATGAFLLMGQTLRWDPLIERLTTLADELRPLRTVILNQRFEPSDRSWLDTPGSGGMFLNTGVHSFDLLRHLTGLEPVYATADATHHLTARTEDAFVAQFRLEPGAVLASVDNTRASASRSGRIELVGAESQLWGDHIHRTLCRIRGREREELGPVPTEATIPRVLASFVVALRDDEDPPCTVDDGRAAVEMVAAAERAAREGRRVTLAEVRSSAGVRPD